MQDDISPMRKSVCHIITIWDMETGGPTIIGYTDNNISSERFGVCEGATTTLTTIGVQSADRTCVNSAGDLFRTSSSSADSVIARFVTGADATDTNIDSEPHI